MIDPDRFIVERRLNRDDNAAIPGQLGKALFDYLNNIGIPELQTQQMTGLLAFSNRGIMNTRITISLPHKKVENYLIDSKSSRMIDRPLIQ